MAWYQVVLIFGDTIFLTILLDRPAVTRLETKFEDDVYFSFYIRSICAQNGYTSCCNESVSDET